MVCGLHVATLLSWTPIFEWFMLWFVVKNGHQKDKCYKVDMHL